MTASAEAMATWWQRKLEALREEPSIGSAVLSGSWMRYGAHRLRGFAISRGGGAALHVVETLILARLVEPHQAIIGFIVANLAVLTAAAWWGATEVLRKKLRELVDAGEQEAHAASWLAWSFRFAALVIVAAIAVPFAVHSHGVILAYCVALMVRVALDLPLRVWHSRVAARGRVFRPPWLSLFVEAIGPILVLSLRSTAGRWTVLISFIASSLAARAVTLYFIRAASQRNGYPWQAPRWRAPRSLPWLAVAGHAIAGIATRVPQIVGVTFLLSRILPMNITVGLQLAVGLLSAATGWCWTHYHDLLPMQHIAMARFRRAIERAVIIEGVCVGALVGAVTVIVVGAMTPRTFIVPDVADLVMIHPPQVPSPWPYAVVLPALAVALSLLSAMHVIAWTRDRLGVVTLGGALAAGVAMIAPSIAWWWNGHGYMYNAPPSWLRAQHVTLTVAMLAIVALSGWLIDLLPRRPMRGRIEWIDAVVAARNSPANVAVLSAARGGTIGHRVGETLAAAGATWWSRREHSILVAGLPTETIDLIAIRTGGWVTSVRAWSEVQEFASDAAAPAPRDDALFVDIVKQRAVPRGGGHLTRYDLTCAWNGLMTCMRGGLPGDVVIGNTIFDGDELVSLTVRMRRGNRV